MSTRSARYGTLAMHTPKGRMVSGVDRDAGAFLEAAQIFNTRQQQAIFELVGNMKRYGIWQKTKAVYPLVGGTATTHKWNLKDPRDVDGAFRLVFTGGWTHSDTGAKGNGTNGYAQTFFGPATSLSISSAHGFIYNRENRDGSNGTTINDFGVAGAFSLLSRFNNNYYFDCYGNQVGNSRIQIASFTDRSGFIGGSRTAQNVLKAFRNGVQIGSTATGNNTTFAGVGLLALSAYNQSTSGSWTPTNYSDMSIGFASFGDGLTDDQCLAYNNIVQLFQRRLGRGI